MAFFVERECSCGERERQEVNEQAFDEEVDMDAGGCVSLVGDDDIITYYISSCKVCRSEQEEMV